jgi:hypothetical protein
MFSKLTKDADDNLHTVRRNKLALYVRHYYHVQPVSARGNLVFYLVFAVRITAHFLDQRARMKGGSSEVAIDIVERTH